MSALITLTTDFGTRDTYVAEMKATILALAPTARLLDVTHDVARHDVLEGALAIEALAATAPAGTIHLAVIDPGVGSARRGIVLTAGGQVFVGPDNGLFTPFLGHDGCQTFELAVPTYRRPTVSRTFHGRDVFAPAAAHLALGVAPAQFGPAVSDLVRLAWPEARSTRHGVEGAVIHVDRFGNLLTSIDAALVETTLDRLAGRAALRVRGRTLPIVGTFEDLPRGAAGALVGSHNRLEVVVREGSAARTLGAGRGTPVALSQPSRSSRTWQASRSTRTWRAPAKRPRKRS